MSIQQYLHVYNNYDEVQRLDISESSLAKYNVVFGQIVKSFPPNYKNTNNDKLSQSGSETDMEDTQYNYVVIGISKEELYLYNHYDGLVASGATIEKNYRLAERYQITKEIQRFGDVFNCLNIASEDDQVKDSQKREVVREFIKKKLLGNGNTTNNRKQNDKIDKYAETFFKRRNDSKWKDRQKIGQHLLNATQRYSGIKKTPEPMTTLSRKI